MRALKEQVLLQGLGQRLSAAKTHEELNGR